jgi:hypothetical protein
MLPVCAALAAGWSLALASPVTPPDAMAGFRCPDTGNLIDTGATTYDVRQRCREPDDVAAHVEVRRTKERIRHGHGRDETEEVVEHEVEVQVEEWVYDFGDGWFLRHLRFENGRLVSVREGARSTKPPRPAP